MRFWLDGIAYEITVRLAPTGFEVEGRPAEGVILALADAIVREREYLASGESESLPDEDW